MNNNMTITNTKNLQAQLVRNAGLTVNNMLNDKKIAHDDFIAWKDLVKTIQPSAYALYEAHENHESKEVKKTLSDAVINAVKPVLKAMGTLYRYDSEGNAHESVIIIDDDFVDSMAIVCTMYAGKLGKKEEPELQLVRSQYANANSMIKKYEGKNGISPEYIENLKAQREEYEEKIDELLTIIDMSKPVPVPVSDSSFRKQFELHMGRILKNQQAQSWEEYQAIMAERKAKSKAKAKERKQAKRQAQAENK